MILSGKALLAGVIGWPIAHSRSPRLHNFWLSRHGIDGCYVPLAVRPEHLESVLSALPRMGIRGVNLTLPHKEAAFSIVDHLDSWARDIGAVNTIVVNETGELEGRNTDAIGFLQNLRQCQPAFDLHCGPCVVLGAGGASRAVIVALLNAGVREIRLINRTFERALELSHSLGSKNASMIQPIDWQKRTEALEGALLLVNTTSLGMIGQPPLEMDLSALSTRALIADIVYTPLETDLLKRGAARGNAVVDGLGMLLHQACPGFSAWFGATPEIDDEVRRLMVAP